MKAVVSIIGKDGVGIAAAATTALAERNINIEDISQTVMEGQFVMTMVVDAANFSAPFAELESSLQKAVAKFGVFVHVQHVDLFNAMQRV